MPSSGCSNYDLEQWRNSGDVFVTNKFRGGGLVGWLNPNLQKVDWPQEPAVCFPFSNRKLRQF